MRVIPGLLASTQGLGTGVLISQIEGTKIGPVLGGQIMSSIMPSLYKPSAALCSVVINHYLGRCVIII